MQKYYPVLSIFAAILFLLLPIVILSLNSAKDKLPEPVGAPPETTQQEFRDLKDQLTLISSKLPELERAVAELQESTELAASPQTRTSADPSLEPRTPRIATNNAQQGVLPKANPPVVKNDKQSEMPAGSHGRLKQISQLVEQPNKSSAETQSSRERNVVPRENQASAPPQSTDALAVSPAVASPSPAADVVIEHPSPTEMTTATDEHSMPAPVDVLTAGELRKEATRNLRERGAMDEPSEDFASPQDVVEILLQTPMDGMTVNRVEQLYAQSRSPGWPVVLVRSSFDDEEWWAQPIGGRRGTQIMSRVHFGNDRTPRGSAFSMVILLLDGYEEAVRFRTARRFTKIPKGIRRSREFMFVLK